MNKKMWLVKIEYHDGKKEEKKLTRKQKKRLEDNILLDYYLKYKRYNYSYEHGESYLDYARLEHNQFNFKTIYRFSPIRRS